jgi:hypothetical protein
VEFPQGHWPTQTNHKLYISPQSVRDVRDVASFRDVGDVVTRRTWLRGNVQDVASVRDVCDVGDVSAGRGDVRDVASVRDVRNVGDVSGVKKEGLSTCPWGPLGPLPPSKSLEMSGGHWRSLWRSR